MRSRIRTVLRWLLTVFMVVAGANHFLAPAAYVAMMPSALPAPLALVYISGVAEILGGLGLTLPATRRLAGWGLIALFVAIFPANINMAVHHLSLGGREIPAWALWARLPLQAALVVWAWWCSRPVKPGAPPAR
ncbi:MAG TPA: DoxX family membrane protein [Polyangia bacterium]|nr:DoxX family membrane protein [Polyangia bacterium]